MIEYDPLRFGRAVRALRREAGVTQEALAEQSGVTQTAIARIERGRAVQIRLETAARLASVFRDYFGIGLDDMLAPDDPSQRSPRW